MDDVFIKRHCCNTLTGVVFEARETNLKRFIEERGIKQKIELEMTRFLIKECHYREDEIQAAKSGKIIFHDHEECVKLIM